MHVAEDETAKTPPETAEARLEVSLTVRILRLQFQGQTHTLPLLLPTYDIDCGFGDRFSRTRRERERLHL